MKAAEGKPRSRINRTQPTKVALWLKYTESVPLCNILWWPQKVLIERRAQYRLVPNFY